jgi:hypothetical protein
MIPHVRNSGALASITPGPLATAPGSVLVKVRPQQRRYLPM